MYIYTYPSWYYLNSLIDIPTFHENSQVLRFNLRSEHFYEKRSNHCSFQIPIYFKFITETKDKTGIPDLIMYHYWVYPQFWHWYSRIAKQHSIPIGKKQTPKQIPQQVKSFTMTPCLHCGHPPG